MDIIRILLIAVEVVTCLLLLLVILLQQSKSSGLGVAFGGGMSESLFGSRAGNVLTKTTIILTGVFLVTTTLLGIMYSNAHEESLVDQAGTSAPAAPVQQPAQQQPVSQPASGPGQGTLVTLDEAAPSGEPVMVEDAVPAEPSGEAAPSN